MFRFEHSYILFGLLLIPLCTLIFIMMLRWKKKALNSFGDAAIIDQLMPDKSESRPVTKFVFLMLAFVFLILAGANPQIGSKLDKIQRKGVDLMIALDVSNSMLAEDIKPNRLERAKQALSKLIDRLENDRIGIIVFAGKAYTQLPITSDYAAAKMYLSLITTGIVPTQGTAIGDAIKMAEKSFICVGILLPLPGFVSLERERKCLSRPTICSMVGGNSNARSIILNISISPVRTVSHRGFVELL